MLFLFLVVIGLHPIIFIQKQTRDEERKDVYIAHVNRVRWTNEKVRNPVTEIQL